MKEKEKSNGELYCLILRRVCNTNLQRGLKKVKNEYKYTMNVSLFLFNKNIF